MKTTLYLIRHGAVAQLSSESLRLQTPLAPLGLRQAERTRDFLAVRGLDQCFCSPAMHALQTAAILVQPHGLEPQTHDGLAEIVLGESLCDFQMRVRNSFEGLFEQHIGQTLLVVAHLRVQRAFLAGLLGMGSDQAQSMRLEPCGISVAVRNGDKTNVSTLNASFHLQGLAA